MYAPKLVITKAAPSSYVALSSNLPAFI